MTATSSNYDFKILRQVAPGTELREAIELIIRQDTGALIVLGGGAQIDSLSSGGFGLERARFTPQRLAELAKMDGAIILDGEAEHILKANVQLNPDPAIETAETGMRNRTAERVALQTEHPVISVSEGRESATVYTVNGRYELQSPTVVLAQANQSVQSLERLRRRLEEAVERLSRAEATGSVQVHDVIAPLQRAALVRRLGRDLDIYAVELGDEGQLLRLQISELVSGADHLIDLVYRDYSGSRAKRPDALRELGRLPLSDLADLNTVASVLDLGSLDAHVRPRGKRVLDGVPRLPDSVETALLDHFDSLEAMLAADEAELAKVEGVGRARARQLRRYFDRMLDLTHHLAIEED